MKTLLIMALLAVGTLSSCQKRVHHHTDDMTPAEKKACVEQKLLNFQQLQETCNDATIKSYTFQSKIVYVLDYGTCIADMTSEVISEDCKSLGYLGGLSGSGKINGTDFWSNATFLSVVWHK